MSAYRGRPEFVGAALECRAWAVAALCFYPLTSACGVRTDQRGRGARMWPICDLGECPLFGRGWELTGRQSPSREYALAT